MLKKGHREQSIAAFQGSLEHQSRLFALLMTAICGFVESRPAKGSARASMHGSNSFSYIPLYSLCLHIRLVSSRRNFDIPRISKIYNHTRPTLTTP